MALGLLAASKTPVQSHNFEMDDRGALKAFQGRCEGAN